MKPFLKIRICRCLHLLAFIMSVASLSGCQYFDGYSDDVLNQVEDVGIIPSSQLGDWDNGFIIGGNNCLCYKQLEDSLGFRIIGFISNADSLSRVKVVFEADEEYKINTITSDDDVFLFSYTQDSVYVTSYNKHTEIYKKESFFYMNEGLLPQTKGVSIGDIQAAATIIDNYFKAASFTNNANVNATGEACRELAADLVIDGTVGIVAAGIGVGAVVTVAVVGAIVEGVKATCDIIENNKAMPYLGKANSSISSFNENGIVVSILGSETLPKLSSGNTASCVVTLKYIGLDNRLGDVSISGADYKGAVQIEPGVNTIHVQLPLLKFGYYLATPYLINNGYSRKGSSAGFYCSKLDQLPYYSVNNYSFNSNGTGSLTLHLTANMEPLMYDFWNQSISLSAKNGSRIMYLSTKTNCKKTETLNLKVSELALDYSNYTANLPISAMCNICPSTAVGPSFDYELEPVVLSYSERPMIRFESVQIDRTERKTEKKNAQRTTLSKGTYSDNPDEDEEEEEEEITYYTTYFSAKYTIEGGFWIKSVSNQSSGTAASAGLTNIKSNKNGLYSYSGILKYTSETTNNNARISCTLLLMNGTSISSSNSLTFSGGEEITSANCN